MDTMISSLYNELQKVQSINDWRYADSFSGQQFQQFSSKKHNDANFNYILCKMTDNKGQWCTAVK